MYVVSPVVESQCDIFFRKNLDEIEKIGEWSRNEKNHFKAF